MKEIGSLHSAACHLSPNRYKMTLVGQKRPVKLISVTTLVFLGKRITVLTPLVNPLPLAYGSCWPSIQLYPAGSGTKVAFLTQLWLYKVFLPEFRSGCIVRSVRVEGIPPEKRDGFDWSSMSARLGHAHKVKPGDRV